MAGELVVARAHDRQPRDPRWWISDGASSANPDPNRDRKLNFVTATLPISSGTPVKTRDWESDGRGNTHEICISKARYRPRLCENSEFERPDEDFYHETLIRSLRMTCAFHLSRARANLSAICSHRVRTTSRFHTASGRGCVETRLSRCGGR